MNIHCSAVCFCVLSVFCLLVLFVVRVHSGIWVVEPTHPHHNCDQIYYCGDLVGKVEFGRSACLVPSGCPSKLADYTHRASHRASVCLYSIRLYDSSYKKIDRDQDEDEERCIRTCSDEVLGFIV